MIWTVLKRHLAARIGVLMSSKSSTWSFFYACGLKDAAALI
jgi:hypothetical protein